MISKNIISYNSCFYTMRVKNYSKIYEMQNKDNENENTTDGR